MILIKIVKNIKVTIGVPASQSVTSPINSPLFSRRREGANPLSSLFISSSFPSTQPTIPALSEASSRHINVIFPLVFLTAVLNSYETLKAAARWESLAGLSARVSREGFSPAIKKKKKILFSLFCHAPSIHPSTHSSIHPSPFSFRPISPCSLMHVGDSRSRQAFIHKNLMKLDRKVHKNLIRSSLPDIWYKSNLGALQRIGVISSAKQRVFERGKRRDLKTCASRVFNVRVRWHRRKWWLGFCGEKKQSTYPQIVQIELLIFLFNW